MGRRIFTCDPFQMTCRVTREYGGDLRARGVRGAGSAIGKVRPEFKTGETTLESANVARRGHGKGPQIRK